MGWKAADFTRQRGQAMTAVQQQTNSIEWLMPCLLYTSDAADERSSVDLGGRRIIKKKKIRERGGRGRN